MADRTHRWGGVGSVLVGLSRRQPILMATLSSQEWDDIIGQVRVNHADLSRGWFSQLSPVDLSGGVIRVRASNPMQVRYLDRHCRLAFAESAQTTLGKLVTVSFETDGQIDESEAQPLALSFESEPQLQLNDDYTFENFVVGPGNRLAHAAATAIGDAPGTTYNPFFVHGDVGLGKTHLLQAICHETTRRGAVKNVMYISCETFANHFIEAVERGALQQFRYRYRHADLLVIDDIQFLGERERSQEEFFHTFNKLHQSQRQIIISADCAPPEIPSLENRLISRFKSGLVASIDPPCLETRMAIVRKKAKLRCIEVDEDVVSFIASRIETNIRDLEGALVKLDALSQTHGRPIDTQIAAEALGPLAPQRVITLPQVVQTVTDRFGVRLADLQSKKRTKSITLPRQVCMYLVRELTQHSLEEIGGYFGGRDHSTVIHASRSIQTLCQNDQDFASMIDELRQAVQRERHHVA